MQYGVLNGTLVLLVLHEAPEAVLSLHVVLFASDNLIRGIFMRLRRKHLIVGLAVFLALTATYISAFTVGAAYSAVQHFDSKPAFLTEDSRGYQQALFIYFEYRETDFKGGNTELSSSNVLKSEQVSSFEKARTAAVSKINNNGILAILDADVSVRVAHTSAEGNLLSVTAYEWTTLYYDDLSDPEQKTDVSGFGTLHQMTLSYNGSDFSIISDSYDERDILGIATTTPAGEETAVTLDTYLKSAAHPWFYNSYNPNKAAAYADHYVWKGSDMSVFGSFENFYNPEYFNFNPDGGDCANFVSQSLYAGGLPQTLGDNYSQNSWHFMAENERSGTWTSSTLLRRWLASYYGVVVDHPENEDIYIGSPVFYSNNGGISWAHTTICVGVNSAGTPVVNSHNNDRYHVIWNYWPDGTTISTVQLTHQEWASSETQSSDKLSISTYGYPTVLKTGRGFPVYGTVTSQRSAIESVIVSIYDLQGNLALSGTYAPKTKTAVLDRLDASIRFGSLAPGWYYYTVSASNQSSSDTLVHELFLVNEGSGTQSDPYLIETADELAGLASAVNSGQAFEGKYFRLNSDLSLNDQAWTPIGTQAAPFSGHFDGNAHRISLDQNESLFGYTAQGEISNLETTGQIVSFNGGAVVNCILTNENGTLVGSGPGKVENCWAPDGALTVSALNNYVENTDSRYFLWKPGAVHPEFAPLTVAYYLASDTSVPQYTMTGLTYAARVAPPSMKLPEGHTLDQWYTNSNATSLWNNDTITENMRLYASSKLENYTVILDPKGGSEVKSPGVVTYSDTIGRLPTPEREGYTFTGWYLSLSDSNSVDWTSVPDLGSDGAALTLHAGWKAPTFTLILNAPGADNTPTASTDVALGSSRLSIPILPEKPDAGFAGCSTIQGELLIDLNGKLVPSVAPYTDSSGRWLYTQQESLSLNAAWTDGFYTVTYHTSYGRLDDCNEVMKNKLYTQSYETGVTTVLPLPVRNGYTFRGWHASSDATGAVQRSLKGSDNTHLYAKWIADNLVWDNTFSDIRPNDWYYDAVRFVSQTGIMDGLSNTRFEPGDTMTRAMLATVLWQMEGSPKPTGENTFSDVLENEWYTDAVVWACENGFATGYGDGRFGTNDGLTREAFAAMLYHYAKNLRYADTEDCEAALAPYADRNKISGYAVDPLCWAVEAGILAGTASDKLSPDAPVERAMAASILTRFEKVMLDAPPYAFQGR